VTKDLILQKVKSFKNYGKIMVPKEAYGAVLARCEENIEKIGEEG
jgi:hypothetical protein